MEQFIAGARVAFEYILNAFAAGDSGGAGAAAEPGGSANFAQSIRDRQAAGQRLETKLVAIKSAELVEAYMAGRTAHVTVKFVSEQISALYDADGAVIEGDPNADYRGDRFLDVRPRQSVERSELDPWWPPARRLI